MPLTKEQTAIMRHLGYEWWMFRSMWKNLSQLPEKADPVRNAMLEALLLHARVVIEFFFSNPTTKRRRDDWTVENLFPGTPAAPMPEEVVLWKADTDKRVAHMTSSRGKLLSEWRIGLVNDHLEPKIADLKARLAENFPIDWTGDASTDSFLLKEEEEEEEEEFWRHDTMRCSLGPTGPSTNSDRSC